MINFGSSFALTPLQQSLNMFNNTIIIATLFFVFFGGGGEEALKPKIIHHGLLQLQKKARKQSSINPNPLK